MLPDGIKLKSYQRKSYALGIHQASKQPPLQEAVQALPSPTSSAGGHSHTNFETVLMASESISVSISMSISVSVPISISISTFSNVLMPHIFHFNFNFSFLFNFLKVQLQTHTTIIIDVSGWATPSHNSTQHCCLAQAAAVPASSSLRFNLASTCVPSSLNCCSFSFEFLPPKENTCLPLLSLIPTALPLL